jgi:hypothetical protein
MFGVRQQKRLRFADVVLLAALDRLHDTLSGPATNVIWMAPRVSITSTFWPGLGFTFPWRCL